jgi:transcriptional regulator with XRE-family HTH domain
MTNLGEHIKERRKESGLTLRGFASQADIAPAFVVDIEAGHRMPSHGVLARIADILDIPLADLQALDPRVTPEVREWMDGNPRVSGFLRKLCEHPDRDALLLEMERQLAD